MSFRITDLGFFVAIHRMKRMGPVVDPGADARELAIAGAMILIVIMAAVSVAALL